MASYTNGAGEEPAEAELRRRVAEAEKSAATWRSLLEASQDYVFVIDREDRVVYVNRAAAALFGTQPEALIGRRRAVASARSWFTRL